MTLLAGNKRIRDVKGKRATLAFTLIELILVMAMLLIVVAVAAPSLARFFRGRTLESEARQIVSLARYGQSRAVSEGMPMVLWVDPTEGSYGLQQQAGYSDEDFKRVEFALNAGLEIEKADTPAFLDSFIATPPIEDPSQVELGLFLIRFLPDGFISQTSPQGFLLAESRSGDSIWIAQSRNRLRYEIQTNQFAQLARKR